MRYDSVIVSFFVKSYMLISYYYNKSLFSSIMCFFGKVIKNCVSGSWILSFITRDWGFKRSLNTSCFDIFATGVLNNMGYRYRNSNGIFKNILEASFFVKLLDTNILYYSMLVVAFFIPFLSTNKLVALILLVLGIFIISIVLGRIKLRTPTAVDYLLLIFSICLFYGTVTSYELKHAIKILIVYGVFIMFYFIVTNTITDKKQLKVFLMTLLVSGIIVALIGVKQYFFGAPQDDAWINEEMFSDIKTRVYSTFGNPNVLGEYLIIITSIAVGFFWSAKKPLGKTVFVGIAMLLGICLIFTMSRGSWLGILFSAFIFVCFIERRLLAVGVIMLFLLPFVLPDWMLNRFASITNMQETSAAFRLSIWKASFNMIKVYWPSGIGIGSFNTVYPAYALEAAGAYHSHNLFIQIMLELGIIGFGAFMTFLTFFYQKLLKTFIDIKDKSSKIFIAAIFGGTAGYLLQGLTEYIWFHFSVLLYFFTILAIGTVLCDISKREQGEIND